MTAPDTPIHSEALLRDVAVATPIQPILAAPRPTNYNGTTLNGESWFVG